MKSVVDVNICISENPTREFGLLVFVVGAKIPRSEDGKETDTILKIEVSEWRRRVVVTYSSGSIVTYKGFRFIYGVKAHS
jgi:hypothetical protein